MNYVSTRDRGESVSAAQAIAQGICGNGGLFVPEAFPTVPQVALSGLDYRGKAVRIMTPYLSDFSAEELGESTALAYAPKKFSGGNPAPLTALGGGLSVLELWHGPTCAFKDMALQLLPHLLTRSLKKIRAGKDAMILVATSGDTGKAALEGFRDVPGTRVMVFYPRRGVSAMQERQMCTQEGANVSVVGVDGNFDDAQTGVKKIFGDAEIRARLGERGLMFSSANSINWGRLLPQIVYYFSAWCDLLASGGVRPGEEVNFCVPTGNFGDILAAYYAKRMGLPVHRLICASNANDVLTEFLTTGVYNRSRTFYSTISPSMDILVSSNLERLLFHLTDGDDSRVSGWMRALSEKGSYRVDEETLRRIHGLFWAGSCGDAETKEEIRTVYEENRYLCDPHTAVAMRAYRSYLAKTGDTSTHTVVVSTASPYKFAPDVLDALKGASGMGGEDMFRAVELLAQKTGVPVPEQIASLKDKPLRFREVCGREEMGRAVLCAAGAAD